MVSTPPVEYLSFRLQIVSRSASEFEVLAWSPVGEGREEFELDVSDDDAATLSALFLSSWLNEHLEQEGLTDLDGAQPETQSAERVPRWNRPGQAGEWLFELVFQGEVLELFQRSVDYVGANPQSGG